MTDPFLGAVRHWWSWSRTRQSIRAGLLLFGCITVLPISAYAGWKAVETAKTYAITGKNGAELYASIGQKGPKLGNVRVIAHTNFKLTWSRKYEPRGNACVLVSARPNLTITYTLPKPSAQLSAAVRKSWDTFIAGIRSHELVHGDIIKDMVRKIEKTSVGMSVANDPGCRKIREELKQRLSELSLAQRQQSRDFDRAELSQGGNMHQLILKLVSGR